MCLAYDLRGAKSVYILELRIRYIYYVYVPTISQSITTIDHDKHADRAMQEWVTHRRFATTRARCIAFSSISSLLPEPEVLLPHQ